MRVGGKVLGSVVLIVTLLIVVFSLQYTRSLESQRNQAIEQLMSLPQYEECKYDASTCPQVEETIVIPDLTGIGLAVLGLLLGIYLIQSDHTHQTLLDELKTRRSDIGADERRSIVMSVLTPDERKVVQEVRKQDGISQATLRLRADFSKTKLSTLLAELERRGIVTKTLKGKTNLVHLKRDL